MSRLLFMIAGYALVAVSPVFSQGEVDRTTTSQGGYLRFSNTVTRTWAQEGLVAGLYWGVDAASVTNLVLPLATLRSGLITLNPAVQTTEHAE